ncbi:MAG: DegV family EDD domain-containing protein [Acidiferrobacterales bacterium]|nr:DegV family EDD domain-containing protein [Acidiferrobacterales bacterium]
MPAIRYLNGRRLHRALQAGIARVVARREYINRINVFPVPDGDTGTNMAFTLVSILHQTRDRVEQNISSMMGHVADAALDGSRGNSGAILAQFLQGLHEGCRKRRTLTAKRFCAAVERGAAAAREAISEPRDGTILSVIHDFSTELNTQLHNGTDDIVELLNRGLDKTRKSLARTTSQLAVLQQAGVVDAGAQGFVDLLEGVYEFVHKGSIREIPQPETETIEDDEGAAGQEMDLTHRFCTECVITGDNIDRLAMRQQLADIGSSLVIAGTQRKARVHVHVNNPDDAYRICEQYGTVSSQKADDMHAQQQAAHSQRSEVAIITDSGADIPDSELERLNIHIVPLRVNFGDRDYLDKVSLSSEEFYQKMREGKVTPRTSQPPVGDFRRQFQFLASHHENVVSINLSDRLSGTHRAAQTANDSKDSGLQVYDSRNVSAGQGLLVMYAAELAKAGYPAEEILKRLDDVADLTKTYAVVPDLSYAVRGGRVPLSKKRIADWLHLTPVIANNREGRVVSKGVLLGRTKLVPRFAHYLEKRATPAERWRVVVGHWDNLADAEALAEELRRRIKGIESLHILDAGVAVGAHAGLGALVVGLQPWRDITLYRAVN